MLHAFVSLTLAATSFPLVASLATSLACCSANHTYPSVFGTEIISLTAVEVRNYSTAVETSGAVLAANLTGLNFCSINVTYTHPGWNDLITVTTWLPLTGWNGRFQGTGGGGWATGSDTQLVAPAVAAGYAAATTDGGHSNLLVHPDWALSSPGNVNYFLLQDFASVALSDMTVIGQALTESFYGRPAAHSYWNGCSTGGRQGLMLAQRYPELYDGILALAPAINWDSFIVAEYWAQHVMNRIAYYPPACELEAFTAAAIAACDDLDGVVDGIISDENACDMDPHSVIGQSFLCNGTVPMQLTAAGAEIALAAWTGPVDASGKKQWYGLNRDANLTAGLVATTASLNGTLTSAPFPIPTDWIKFFIEKDPLFNIANISDAEYFRILHESRNQYAGIINTADPT
ncbi:hypothetical protein LTR08_006487 [Meristemomyces frigidus]|nr:hypothetical protein LTR08_006487 [Meristemomyces frigidus]